MSEVAGGMDSAPGGDAIDTGAEQGSEAPSQVGGESQPGQPSASQKAQITKDVIRELGEQDLDAVVKVKINGKEQTMKVRDALKKAELGEGAQSKMQQAAQLRQQAEQIIRFARANPKEFFKQTGVDPYEFAEATLAEKYEMMQMSPEQKRLMELEKKNKDYEDREKQMREEREKHERSQTEHKLRGEIENEIVEAWKESGLPRHKYFAARIAAEMGSSLAQKKAGVIDQACSAKEAAANVKAQVVSELQDIVLQVAKTDPAAAQQLLGNELMKILRDYDVKRVTGSGQATQFGNQRPGTQPASEKSKNSGKQPMSEKEWDKYFKGL